MSQLNFRLQLDLDLNSFWIQLQFLEVLCQLIISLSFLLFDHFSIQIQHIRIEHITHWTLTAE